MNPFKLRPSLVVLAVLLSFSQLTCGAGHTDEALKHAEQAAHSVGDATAIQEHAAEAGDAVHHLEKARSLPQGGSPQK